ncbi:hypothetical protein BD779DRAFT_626758 [Infundibulicybe gibba]|nr:hypothetical protein BD779DRAFT_626758 [Infundibulicybe gibba]
MVSSGCLSRLSIPLLCVHIARAFTFMPGNLSQCDDLTVTWTGGSPPFKLLITPVFGTPRNVIIPSSSFSNGKGSFSTQLPFPQGRQMVLTMSDETGFGAGGSTALLQVEAQHGIDCNTTDLGVAFSFELNSGLQQCRPYIFSDYSGAVQPVTIMGIIPGESSFVLNPPIGPTTFTWIDNITADSSVIFVMEDAQGGLGEVQSTSPATTPLLNASPATASLPSTSPALPSTGSGAASTPTNHNTLIAIIIGSVFGAFLVVLLGLGIFYLKRRRGWNFGSSFGKKFEAPTIAPYNLFHTPSTHSRAHKPAAHSSTPGNWNNTKPPPSAASPDLHDRVSAYSQRSLHHPELPQYHSSLDRDPPFQPPLSRITVHMDLEGHLHSTLREAGGVESPPQYSGIGGIPGAIGFPPAWQENVLQFVA